MHTQEIPQTETQDETVVQDPPKSKKAPLTPEEMKAKAEALAAKATAAAKEKAEAAIAKAQAIAAERTAKVAERARVLEEQRVAKAKEREAAKQAKVFEREAAKEAKRLEREAAKADGNRTTGPKLFNKTEVINLLVDSNPKKPGSAAFGRFSLYTNGMTVEKALEAGVTTADLVHDLGHRFISLSQ